MIINVLGHCSTKSNNVFFGNNEQASLSVFTVVFSFTHAQAVNSNLECALWNSKKPIKFAHLQKVANQSMLNKAYVTEITKAYKVAFMKAGNSLVVVFWCREKKKIEDAQNVFL